MNKTLTALVMAIVFSAGCTSEKSKSLWRLIEVSGEMEHGLKNYYTPAEKRQQKIDLNRDMEYIHSLGKKYKRD